MASHEKKKTAASTMGRYLVRFTLQNVRTFRSEVTLNFCQFDGSVAQWTVILGENGTGKTTLLQYLAGMRPTDQMEGDPVSPAHYGPELCGPGWHAWHAGNLSRGAKSEESIKASLLVSTPTETINSSSLKKDSRKSIELYIDFNIIKDVAIPIGFGTWNSGHKKLAYELRLFAYGASRHVASAASPYISSETFFKNGGNTPTSTLFHDDYPLISPEQWLLGLDHIASSQGRDSKVAKRSFESAKRCIINTLPGIYDISIKQQRAAKGLPSMTLFCRTSFGEVPFSALSLGYRTMTAWLIDFVKRMHEAFPDLKEPDDGPSIVLIDEFDLHMHPKWQREAMAALSREFPNTQFIVTAHSPLVVQAAGANAKIVVLQRRIRADNTEEVVLVDHPHEAAGWRIDQILESFYGVSSRSPRFEELVEQRVKLRRKAKLTPSEKRHLAGIESELDSLEPPDESSASKALLADLKKALEAACSNPGSAAK